MRLFAPYWRTIAINIVQDLQRRPQVAQQMSDLLAITVSDFLQLTQYYTTPYLVLTKRRDLLQKVAVACGRSIKDQCMDHNNLGSILACILLQSSNDMENMIMALLNAVSSDFNNVDCADLVKAEPMLTAAELLKAAGEDGQMKRSRVSYNSPCQIRNPNTDRCRPIKRSNSLPKSRTVEPDLLVVQPEKQKLLAHSLKLMFLVSWHISLTLSTMEKARSLWWKKSGV